jgi:sn-glycerol 3-phosphate transport system permease protein
MPTLSRRCRRGRTHEVFIDSFVGLDYGASSTQSMIIMAIVIGLTVIQFRYIERRIHYA